MGKMTCFCPLEPTLGLKILNIVLSPLVTPLSKSVFKEITVTFRKTRHKPKNRPRVCRSTRYGGRVINRSLKKEQLECFHASGWFRTALHIYLRSNSNKV